MNNRKGGFFWVGYSDLMTSLFFIMLLLFVLSSAGMYVSKAASENQLRKIKDLQTAVNQLDTTYFQEDSVYKRWVLKKSIVFPKGLAKMPEEYKPHLIKVGQSLMKVINRLNDMKKQEEYRDLDVRYLVVIEGMASNDNYDNNDVLSYARALSLYLLWRKNGISFEASQCEVQIAGSGTRGLGRYTKPEDEARNQRIIIQIVPKIGNLKD